MKSPQQRFILFSLPGILLGLLAGLYLVAAFKRGPKSKDSSIIVKHAVEGSPDEALKYWTTERKHQAEAMPLPHLPAQHKQEPPHTTP